MADEPKKKYKKRSDYMAIHPSDLPKIKQLAGLGLAKYEIAHVFGMTRETFHQRMRENPLIALTIEEGKSGSKKNLLAKSYLKAMGTDPNSPDSGDNDMLKYLLSRIHGLSEKQVMEHRAVKVEEDYTVDELRQKILELEDKNQCKQLAKEASQ